uniref:LmrA/YxaF family transcription factor n=1 Tax=Streptomyces blattellae TaxID=2569855 RepID=UPI0038B5FBEE
MGASSGRTRSTASATWIRPVAEALVGMGVAEGRAEPLATLVISALEGARSGR